MHVIQSCLIRLRLQAVVLSLTLAQLLMFGPCDPDNWTNYYGILFDLLTP